MDDNGHHEEALIRVWVTRWILNPVARPCRSLKPGKDTQNPLRVNRVARPQAAERIQRTLDGIYVVGGTAAALWAGDRTSHDADHHMPDLEHRFSEVLDRLEALPGYVGLI